MNPLRGLPAFRKSPRRHVDRPAGPANPFEAGLLIVCTIQGFWVLTGLATPSSIQLSLGPGLRFVWALLLFLGGGASILGLWWPYDPVDGVLIKRVGLLAAAGGTFAYGLALVFIGPVGFVVALYNIGFAVVCLIRAWQVSLALAVYRMHLAAFREVTVQTAPDEGGPLE